MLPRKRENTTLGNLVSDYHQKKFSLWEYNRKINTNRAHAIASYYINNNYDAGPQPIIIGVLPNGSAVILDGQHRLYAGDLLKENANIIDIEVIYEYCLNEEQLRKTFKLINIGTPVPIAYWEQEVNTFVRETSIKIKNRWPKAYSKSSSATRPWFTDNSLEENLGNNRCREALILGVLTPEGFLEELIAVCQEIEKSYKTNPSDANKRYSTTKTETVFPKALEKDFCAGVLVRWGEYVADRMILQISG
jgi:hypothetical protein